MDTTQLLAMYCRPLW